MLRAAARLVVIAVELIQPPPMLVLLSRSWEVWRCRGVHWYALHTDFSSV